MSSLEFADDNNNTTIVPGTIIPVQHRSGSSAINTVTTGTTGTLPMTMTKADVVDNADNISGGATNACTDTTIPSATADESQKEKTSEKTTTTTTTAADEHPRYDREQGRGKRICIIGGSGPEAGINVMQKCLRLHKDFLTNSGKFAKKTSSSSSKHDSKKKTVKKTDTNKTTTISGGTGYHSDKDSVPLMLLNCPEVGGPHGYYDLEDVDNLHYTELWENMTNLIRDIDGYGSRRGDSSSKADVATFCIACNTLHAMAPRLRQWIAEENIRANFVSICEATKRAIIRNVVEDGIRNFKRWNHLDDYERRGGQMVVKHMEFSEQIKNGKGGDEDHTKDFADDDVNEEMGSTAAPQSEGVTSRGFSCHSRSQLSRGFSSHHNASYRTLHNAASSGSLANNNSNNRDNNNNNQSTNVCGTATGSGTNGFQKKTSGSCCNLTTVASDSQLDDFQSEFPEDLMSETRLSSVAEKVSCSAAPNFCSSKHSERLLLSANSNSSTGHGKATLVLQASSGVKFELRPAESNDSSINHGDYYNSNHGDDRDDNTITTPIHGRSLLQAVNDDATVGQDDEDNTTHHGGWTTTIGDNPDDVAVVPASEAHTEDMNDHNAKIATEDNGVEDDQCSVKSQLTNNSTNNNADTNDDDDDGVRFGRNLIVLEDIPENEIYVSEETPDFAHAHEDINNKQEEEATEGESKAIEGEAGGAGSSEGESGGDPAENAESNAPTIPTIPTRKNPLDDDEETVVPDAEDDDEERTHSLKMREAILQRKMKYQFYRQNLNKNSAEGILQKYDREHEAEKREMEAEESNVADRTKTGAEKEVGDEEVDRTLGRAASTPAAAVETRECSVELKREPSIAQPQRNVAVAAQPQRNNRVAIMGSILTTDLSISSSGEGIIGISDCEVYGKSPYRSLFTKEKGGCDLVCVVLSEEARHTLQHELINVCKRLGAEEFLQNNFYEFIREQFFFQKKEDEPQTEQNQQQQQEQEPPQEQNQQQTAATTAEQHQQQATTERKADYIVLGCTELPLLLRPEHQALLEADGLRVIDPNQELAEELLRVAGHIE